MTVTRGGFSQVVGNAYAGFGFAPEGPTVYEFPIPMFIPDSDLTPINENIDKIVYGLTKWQPKITAKGTFYAPTDIKVQGADYPEAFDKFNYLYMSKEWGDGLPIIPPTKEKINWIMTGTDLPPDTVIGEKVLPRGGIATVHDIALNLAMAGGRPEYMPVVMAAVEAITAPSYLLSHVNPTTRPNWPSVIVNGTIGKQIRINSGYWTMGPHNLFPAQGPIGRCIRFIMQNFGGGVAGKGSMAIFGMMYYTNAVAAEDEDGLPPGWTSYGEDRGFPRGANCVTAMSVHSVERLGTSTTAPVFLDHCEEVIGTEGLGGTVKGTSDITNTSPDVRSGVILMSRGLAGIMYAAGYSKEMLKQEIWQRTHYTNNPSQLTIVVAGGDQGGHPMYLGVGQGDKATKAIKELPAKWNDLLKQAETDLGPIQDQHLGGA